MGRELVLHLDADCFAVSIERARNAKLARRPVIVGNEAAGRGIVVCASYEARRHGIRNGMPLSIARRQLPEAVLLPVNMLEYQAVSSSIRELLRCRAPVVEAASIDDFYLDLSGCERLYGGSILNWARKLGGTIRGETGIPFSLSLASNKMVARVANIFAKPGHMLEVSPGTEKDFLAPVPVKCLPGIGSVTGQRLTDIGIRYVGQIAAAGEERLSLLFGPAGRELWRRARGEFHEPVRSTSIHHDIVEKFGFEEDSADPEVLKSAAGLIAQRLAWQLRRHSVRSNTIELSLTYSDGRVTARRLILDYPSNRDFDLISPARDAAAKIYERRVRFRSIQLKASFVPHDDGQFDMFMEKCQERNISLYAAIDEVRERHGFNALVAAQALSARKHGELRKEALQ